MRFDPPVVVFDVALDSHLAKTVRPVKLLKAANISVQQAVAEPAMGEEMARRLHLHATTKQVPIEVLVALNDDSCEFVPWACIDHIKDA